MKGLRLTEWITVFLLLLFIVLFSALFFYEQNRSSGEGSGEEIGELNFRYRIAERKFSDSVLWDRINPGDKLKNQDWIRTDSYSEAVLQLSDGSRVEMGPETMLVLVVSEDKKEFQLMQGSVELDLKDDYDLLANNQKIEGLQGKSRIRLTEENLEVEQDETTATLNGESLPSWSIIKEGKIKSASSELTLLAPVDTRTVIDSKTVQITFRWAGSCPCSLFIQPFSPEQAATSISDIKENRYEMELPPGIYTWFVRNSTDESARRSFRLLESQPLKALHPPSGSELSIAGEAGLIQFSWEAPGFQQSFRIEIANDANLSTPIYSRVTGRRNAAFSLQPGEYYWRITSLTGETEAEDTSRDVSSKVLAFKVKPLEEKDDAIAINLKVKSPEEIRKEKQKQRNNTAYTPAPWQYTTYPVFPSPNAAVDMSTRDSLLFRWTPVAGATKYLFRLYRDDSILIERFVPNPYLNFRELTLLDTAWFEWSVEPIFGNGRSGSGFQHRFQVTLSEQLDKPELE